jgi:hypothetical protein
MFQTMPDSISDAQFLLQEYNTAFQKFKTPLFWSRSFGWILKNVISNQTSSIVSIYEMLRGTLQQCCNLNVFVLETGLNTHSFFFFACCLFFSIIVSYILSNLLLA